jgi:hypothetical protein
VQKEISMAVPTTVHYPSTRLTVQVGSTPGEFQAHCEEAVPTWSQDKMIALVERQVSWQEMIDPVHAATPWGFLIYNKIDATPVVRLAGDRASAVNYLMGNHTIMERMFRHEPAAYLYVPLHTVIRSQPEGGAYFTFDQPSGQFASLGHPGVAAVGLELDPKMAALLDDLDVRVPDELPGAAYQAARPGRAGPEGPTPVTPPG